MIPLAADLQSGRDRSVRNNQRRTLRIPLSVPMVVSDLKSHEFSECCETVTANGHGCQLRSSRPLETGAKVRLDAIYTNRTAQATVIHSEPAGREQGAIVWNSGLALDKPGNFWNIPSPPQDWLLLNGSGKKDVAVPVSNLGEQSQAIRHGTSSNPERPQTLSVIETRIAGLEARVKKATTAFEAGALTQLQQSFGEVIGQARERIKRYAVACGESRLVDLEAELERRLEPFLNRSQTAFSDLERLSEALRQQQAAWETRMAQWQQYEEQLRSWLAQETQQFHSLAHDAVVEAGGQVKGRLEAAIAEACEPMERRLRDAEAQLEALVLRKADEVSQRVEANVQRLHAMQAETERSFRSRLEGQQAEVLDLFQQQAKDVMGRTISRMHATLNDAFGSTARALQDQSSAFPMQPRGQDRAGSEWKTTA